MGDKLRDIISVIEWFICDVLFNPLGMIIGGILVAMLSGLILIGVYVFPPTDPAIYTQEYIQQTLNAQPFVALCFESLMIVSILSVVVGYLRGGFESHIP
jgi:hypothetical protein